MKRTAVLVFLLAFGCSTTHGPEYHFPSDISAECYQAMGDAKACIESKGTALTVANDCTLAKHPGERKFDLMWCWWDPGWNQYVGGLCWGNRIEVGCNPETMGEVWYEVEKHEFGHYWLMPIPGETGHDPLYRSCFYNWFDPSAKVFFEAGTERSAYAVDKVRTLCDQAKEGEWVGVSGVDRNGRRYSIDFVVVKGLGAAGRK